MNIRGVTVFPLAIEEVLRGMAALGDEFTVTLTNDTGLDELTVQVEAGKALPAREQESLREELA